MKWTILVFLLAVPVKGEVKPSRRQAERTEVKAVGDKIQIVYTSGKYSHVETLSKEAAIKLYYQLGDAIEKGGGAR